MARSTHPQLAHGGPYRRVHFSFTSFIVIAMTRALAFLLVLAGGILFGEGIYIHAKAALAQVLLARAFDESIATGRDVKPWSWADTWPVARIEVTRLGASAIALAGSSGQALAFGPGHVEATPEAGERGTAVYSAHRDTHFSFLKDVAPGDEIRVTRRDGRTFTFRATAAQVVRFDASGIDPHAGGRALALTTCWPFDSITPGPMRYVLHAVLEEPKADATPH
jgi:sortase A